MNFQQLEYIVAVDRLKHFINASEKCGVTQATLSAMIKKLEKELNCIIFDRSKHPIATTEKGVKIIDKATEILTQRDQLRNIGNEVVDKLSGKLRIGIIPTVANSLLPLILSPILKCFPKLHLEINEITTANIMQKLKNDELDAGILTTPLQNQNYQENILYYESMMVYGINDRTKKYISPKSLEEKQNWLLEEGNCFRNQSITFCNLKNKEIKPSNLIFEGNSFETLLNLTDQFGGYTLIPELYYKNLSKLRQEKSLSFEKPLPVREVSIVHYRTFAKKESIDAISEKIRELIKGVLRTESMHPKDLNIIGIN